MMKRVIVMEAEKWRLVIERLTTLLTRGCWSMNISSSVDKQERPRNVTENYNLLNSALSFK